MMAQRKHEMWIAFVFATHVDPGQHLFDTS